MKHTIKLFLVAALVLLSYQSQANSWRVCSKPEARADFPTCSAAVASVVVVAGDTLYMEPGHFELNGFTINKRLTIIGPGYFLNINNINAMDSREAVFNGSVSLNAEGINIFGCVFNYGCGIHTSNLVVERCYFYTQSISFEGTRTNITIRSCFLNNCNMYFYNYDRTPYLSSSTIENNIFNNCRIYSYNNNTNGGLFQCIIRNNTMKWSGDYYLIHPARECQIYNNIIINYSTDFTVSVNANQTVDTSWFRDKVINATVANGNDVHHNILSCQPNSAFRDCVFNITDWEMVLTGNNAPTLEGKYQHITNGIAVGAGTNGTTCGAYGNVNGTIPYLPAGIPMFRPYIYDANIDQTPSNNNTINASFKIKVQNE